jgi:DNA helicase HerA-like ATPase
VLGDLRKADKKHRALDIAHLANREEVAVAVDGHVIVTRHLAILAMTGSGKTWTARRIIEQLAAKNYPIVIFDPRGDYTGLSDLPSIGARVDRYYAEFPLFEEDAENVARIVGGLGYPLSPTMETRFGDLFAAAQKFLSDDAKEMRQRAEWLAAVLGRPEIKKYGVGPNLWLVANLAEAAELTIRREDAPARQQLADWCWPGLPNYSGKDATTLEAIKKRAYKAAGALQRMKETSQKIAANGAKPLPTDKSELVQYGRISVVSLAGYTGDFQATIYSLVADAIFGKRVDDELKYRVLLVLEEAHNFAPGHPMTPAEERSVAVTRQIAQEGRKFGVGLVLISQRPGRLDETALSMCNSFIIMRMVNPNDQRFVRNVIESLGEDDARMLPELDKGEAIFSGQFISFPVLAKVKPPESRGEHEEEDAFQELEVAHKAMAVDSSSRPRRS